jgi:hypothetical protein
VIYVLWVASIVRNTQPGFTRHSVSFTSTRSIMESRLPPCYFGLPELLGQLPVDSSILTSSSAISYVMLANSLVLVADLCGGS